MIKNDWYPLYFIWWQPIKNNSVTPYVLFHKKRQWYPLDFIWKRRIRNNIVPLTFSLMTADKKRHTHAHKYTYTLRTIYTVTATHKRINTHTLGYYHSFYLKTTDKKLQHYPFMFYFPFPLTLTLTFYFMTKDKNDSVARYVLFHRKQQCFPLLFNWWQPIKKDSVIP